MPKRSPTQDTKNNAKDGSAEQAAEPAALQTFIGMMVAGVIVTTLLLARQASWTFTMIDGGFWVAAISVAAGRYLLVTKYRQPPLEQKRLSSIALTLLAACTVWLAAQAVGDEPMD